MIVVGKSRSSEPGGDEGPDPLPSYTIRAWTAEGGGGEASGGNFGVRGSIGQPEPFTSEGGRFRLQGGFWPVRALDDSIFEDGFESGDTGGWSTTVGGS